MMNQSSDYPLSAVPTNQRKGVWSMMSVLLGFTFFTSTMWAGGKLGSAFTFYEMLGIIFVGNLLLGAYSAGLAYVASIPFCLDVSVLGLMAVNFQISF